MLGNIGCHFRIRTGLFDLFGIGVVGVCRLFVFEVAQITLIKFFRLFACGIGYQLFHVVHIHNRVLELRSSGLLITESIRIFRTKFTGVKTLIFVE